ncbi:MAG: hypothetical protein K0Q65_1650 [Clostridia bacterium]|nr:hypothetical protein [Clostridia bacterium]
MAITCNTRKFVGFLGCIYIVCQSTMNYSYKNLCNYPFLVVNIMLINDDDFIKNKNQNDSEIFKGKLIKIVKSD